MVSPPVSSPQVRRTPLTRREFFKASVCATAGVGLYGAEIERHWIDTTHCDVHLPGLPAEFEGARVAQLSDIHMDEFTEPFFLRDAVAHINSLSPDLVFLTGDFVSHQLGSEKFAEGSAWQCADILTGLKCRQRYAIFGNHDAMVNEALVGAALRANGVAVLRNACLPLERGQARIWLSGIDDPVEGQPDIEKAIPARIRNQPGEPLILLCHAPDYADTLLRHPAGQAVDLMLSGHTHGGQIRLPFLPPFHLPPLGRHYIKGWFQLQRMQLYVNRGLGTIGLPFRMDCPPEIALFTLRGRPRPQNRA